MKTPLVSVVIPTFDRTFFLKRAIESVYAQNYQHLEIIVVVDGESPASEKLIREIKEERIPITYIETKEKVGGSEARNIGARAAKGEYIALLDDDDEWFANKITAQMDLIANDKLSSQDDFLCFTSLKRYKEKSQPVYDKLPNVDYRKSKKKRIIDYLFETKGLRNIGFIQTSTVVVPKHILLETPFTKGLIKHQDWDWLLKLDKEHSLKIIQVEEPEIIYHSDVPKKDRVGYINRWRFTEEWMTRYKDEFSQLGYESFILNYILLGIASDHSLSKQQRYQEIKKRFDQLSFKTKMRPYTWKMIFYLLKEK
ncbi:glycosyltransferase family 2 protein [Pisciglobus halotolerans]|uniref:Glycosyltransferase involved in cell wall bisynthesis n=1 Tax=Pisciglobus halotolerans TaxID=745365 RepID=A0A1I3CPQ2_9LACT|nr:glycosyltransferase family 2 protein [Pisciglobus halotolerans]SFH76502.1 Glycosyltransferase involved in cell wall bisynthesis [Pisciglobus halotolerans]